MTEPLVKARIWRGVVMGNPLDPVLKLPLVNQWLPIRRASLVDRLRSALGLGIRP